MKHLYLINKGTVGLVLSFFISLLIFYLVLQFGVFPHKEEGLFIEFIFLFQIFLVFLPLIIAIAHLVENAKLQKEKGQVSIDTVIYSTALFIKNTLVNIFKGIAFIINYIDTNRETIFISLVLGLFFYSFTCFVYLSDNPLFILPLIFLGLVLWDELMYEEKRLPPNWKKTMVSIIFMILFISIFTSSIGYKVKENIEEYQNKYRFESTKISRKYLHDFPNKDMKIIEYFYFLMLDTPPVELYEYFFEEDDNLVLPVHNRTLRTGV